MKRRTALIRICVAGSASLLTYCGYKWIRWNRIPELSQLKEERELISSLVDTIIPETDTPGAKAVGVHDFIIKMIIECTEIKTQNKFIEGLNELKSHTNQEFGKPFEICSLNERTKILMFFEKKDKPLAGLIGKAQVRYFGKPFFVTLKEYSSFGYFTSQIGATQALRYSLVPSKYIACMPYSSNERAWATY